MEMMLKRHVVPRENFSQLPNLSIAHRVATCNNLFLVLFLIVSIQAGIFFRHGDKCEKSNYRPISLLPVISRLFEKRVYTRLYQYLNSNNLLVNEQSGFRTLHSTLACLLKNTDDWYSGLDNGQLVDLVLIDLRKAFDTVDHNILYQTFDRHGLLGRKLSWSKSYLLSHKQNYSISGVESELMDIDI